MNTVALETTQNINIDYEIASLGDRILAYLIDILIIGALFGVFIFFLVTNNIRDNLTQIFAITLWGIYCFYDLLFEVFMKGQSPGKSLMKIRVMSIQGNTPRFGQYLIRWLFRVVDITLTSGMGAILCIAFSNKKQRIGDIVANTILVKTKLVATNAESLFQSTITAEEYEIHYPEVAKLTPSEIDLIKSAIHIVTQQQNSLIALEVANKMESYLAVRRKEEPIEFLNILLSDYRHLDQ